eukprot:gene31397-40787_t
MSTTVDSASILKEAAAKFLTDENVILKPTSGGVNNVVQYVETGDGSKYVLRVYNNGNNLNRVIFEHAILDSLKLYPLSFRIPTTIPSLKEGLSHVPLSNGAQASLFHVIPGSLPKLRCVKQIGSASAELCAALADSTPKLQPLLSSCPTPPYYELFKVHHAVSRDSFYNTMASTAFDKVREPANRLVAEIQEMELIIARLLKDETLFPKQLIHGDLHYDNVLVEDDKVSGLLDFEFCAFDWRAMELAVCLSKYAGEKDAASYFGEFLSGYGEFSRLTAAEAAVIPDLVNLRILSNVVYFVGRALAGEDSLDSLITRADTYATRVQWIKNNRQAIVDLISEKLRI